jgi:hypothetical protein
MAALGYAMLLCPPDPILRSGQATSQLGGITCAEIFVCWSDGTQDTYATGNQLRSIHDLAATVDATTDAWLVIAASGTPNLWWLREQDIANSGSDLVDAVGGTQYTWLFRADGPAFYLLPQI